MFLFMLVTHIKVSVQWPAFIETERRGQGRLDPMQSVFSTRSHDAVIRVYDEAGNVIDTHEHAGDFKEC
jgi:hypothetical protein